MAESLPTVEFYYREKGAGDAAWEKAVGGQFQAVDGTEYDVCCVRPSLLSSAKWVDARAIVKFASWVASCADRCVDFVGVGDSNQVYANGGWDQGFQVALRSLYPMYATGLVTARENDGGNGILCGYGYQARAVSSAGSWQDSIAKDANAIGNAFAASFPLRNGYVPDGGTIAWTVGPGLSVYAAQGMLDLQSSLKFQYLYGTFDSGSGSARPMARIGASPYTVIASHTGTLTTNTGALGYAEGELLVPADPGRTANVEFWLSGAGSVPITGPFCAMWLRAYDTALTNGFSYHTMFYKGGKTLRYTLNALLNDWTDESLSLYFSIIREGQQDEVKRILLYINFGVNDRYETLPSLGPAQIADGDSPEAYADNVLGFINKIKSIWSLNGWPSGELLFAVSPSHPISDPNDPELESYLVAAQNMASSMSDLVVIPIQSLTDYAEMLSESWYKSAGETIHLSSNGYNEISKRIIAYTGE